MKITIDLDDTTILVWPAENKVIFFCSQARLIYSTTLLGAAQLMEETGLWKRENPPRRKRSKKRE